jgi:hypothetical protein
MEENALIYCVHPIAYMSNRFKALLFRQAAPEWTLVAIGDFSRLLNAKRTERIN